MKTTLIEDAIEKIIDSGELIEIARKSIEDTLIEFRDSRLSQIRGNGLVIREKDGTESSIIRFGPEEAMLIGLKAIAKHLHVESVEEL